LSTIHISEDVADMMGSEHPGIDFVYYTLLFGFKVHVGEYKYPVEMIPHIEKAKELDCQWILYDCDGPEYSEFKIFQRE